MKRNSWMVGVAYAVLAAMPACGGDESSPSPTIEVGGVTYGLSSAEALARSGGFTSPSTPYCEGSLYTSGTNSICLCVSNGFSYVSLDGRCGSVWCSDGSGGGASQ